MNLSKERREELHLVLQNINATEAEIKEYTRSLTRHYSKNTTWKVEIEQIIKETGAITRSQIQLMKGFPSTKNPSRTIIRFIESLQDTLGKKISKQDRDTWVVDEDITKLVSEAKAYVTDTKDEDGNQVNRLQREEYAKSKGWTMVLANEVFKELLRDGDFEDISGGVIREAGA